MARIFPFRAWRYNPGKVNLQDVVTQPYDKISPSMQQGYYQKSPYNLVRIILGLPELFDAQSGETVYTRAARDLEAWKTEGILKQEPEPAIFAYAQRFRIPGTNEWAERRGFIALGQLHDYSEEVVFRHEQTLSKPKADRLNLLLATRAHFGQIFMLYSDPAQSIESILYSDDSEPDATVMDEYEVEHKLWRVQDPATIQLAVAAMEDKKLIIADGHHRYETALRYSKENAPKVTISHERSASSLPQPAYPEAAVMMTFVNMDSDGLVILPTHRVVHGLPSFDVTKFLEAAKTYFDVSPLAETETTAITNLLKQQKGTTLAAITPAGNWLLKARPKAVATALKDQPERQRQLDVVQLHSLVLEQLLGLTPESIRDQVNLRYLRDAGEAIEQVQRGEANVTFLLNPVTMQQLREVAFAGDVMPQKSTDFFPKLLSGLTIYALD